MANRRMLSKSISVSLQVNQLPLEAQLLFTWMIPHADDEGWLEAEPVYIKATVVPMKNWSLVRLVKYLKMLESAGLIKYFVVENKNYIKFPTWSSHQSIRKDRTSKPAFLKKSVSNGHILATSGKPNANQMIPKDKISKYKKKEVNKSEDNLSFANFSDLNQKPEIMSISSLLTNNGKMRDPADLLVKYDTLKYRLEDEEQLAATEIHKRLEPENPSALQTTYLHAINQGIPLDLMYQWCSEIEQDKNINNPGQVFNAKVKNYISRI